MLALACFEEQMGVLSIDATPVTFTAKGETNQVWRASVIPGALYEVVVTPVVVSGQHDGAAITIWEDGDVITVGSTISNGATVTFTGPDSGQIRIEVVASIGEGGRVLGTYTVTINQLEP